MTRKLREIHFPINIQIQYDWKRHEIYMEPVPCPTVVPKNHLSVQFKLYKLLLGFWRQSSFPALTKERGWG